jgi:hypothetical protein
MCRAALPAAEDTDALSCGFARAESRERKAARDGRVAAESSRVMRLPNLARPSEKAAERRYRAMSALIIKSETIQDPGG